MRTLILEGAHNTQMPICYQSVALERTACVTVESRATELGT